jgi:hypothetical protein
MLLLRAKRHRCPQIPSREWEVRGLPPTKGREAERRKAHHNRAAACFPDCRKTEAHGNAFQRPAGATSSTLGPFFRHRRELFSPSRQAFAHPSPVPPRVRRARPPRPQAPHPAPRYKRPGNAPLTGTGCLGIYMSRKICQGGGRLNFWGILSPGLGERQRHGGRARGS